MCAVFLIISRHCFVVQSAYVSLPDWGFPIIAWKNNRIGRFPEAIWRPPAHCISKPLEREGIIRQPNGYIRSISFYPTSLGTVRFVPISILIGERLHTWDEAILT